MKKIAIVTDSNAGIHQYEASDGLFIVPMPFMIDNAEYFEDINLDTKTFYELQAEDKKISTSQPAPGDLTEIWNNILKDYDEIVYLPMSSGLSSSYHNAKMLAEDYNGKVEVVDTKRISVTLKMVVYDCLKLAKSGKSASEILQLVENNSLNSSIYLMVDTLKYLKKGGRITPVVAAIGSLFHIKPILQIQGEKLDKYATVMNVIQAKQKMIAAIKRDIENRFADDYKAGKLQISVAHTNNKEKLEQFAKEVKEAFPDIEFGYADELSLSVACHTGPGVLAITVSKKLTD